MATRSIVGTYTDGGKHWRGRYVHWDGHPETRLPILLDLIERDGALKVLQTIMRHPGWSCLNTSVRWNDPMETGYDDGRFANVDGYGVAYTPAQRPDNTYETDTGLDTWCEYAYIIDLVERNLDVFERHGDSWDLIRWIPYDEAYIPA